MEKNFNNWNNLKKQIDYQKTLPDYGEREVWWCSLGINVGSEQNGKNGLYERPVVVFRKFNQETFWAIPITSKAKHDMFHVDVYFKERISTAVLSQLRLISSKRLLRKIAFLSEKDYFRIKQKLLILIENAKPPPFSGGISEAEAHSE